MIGPKTTYARLLRKGDIFRIPGDNVYWTLDRMSFKGGGNYVSLITTSGDRIDLRENTRVRLFRRKPWHPSQGMTSGPECGSTDVVVPFPGCEDSQYDTGLCRIDGQDYNLPRNFAQDILDTVARGGNVFEMLKEKLGIEE